VPLRNYSLTQYTQQRHLPLHIDCWNNSYQYRQKCSVSYVQTSSDLAIMWLLGTVSGILRCVRWLIERVECSLLASRGQQCWRRWRWPIRCCGCQQRSTVMEQYYLRFTDARSAFSRVVLGPWHTIQVLRPSYWYQKSCASNFANLSFILVGTDLSVTRNLDRIEHTLLRLVSGARFWYQ